jgi:hypothetical protein
MFYFIDKEVFWLHIKQYVYQTRFAGVTSNCNSGEYVFAGVTFILALVVSMVEGFANYEVYAQTNTSKENMTSAMVLLARFHLKAADTALANGNNTAALNELTLAQLQVLSLGMKPMGTVDMAQAMQLLKSTGSVTSGSSVQ